MSYLCQCAQCRSHSFIHPDTHESVRGRFVTNRMFDDHRRDARKATEATTHLLGLFDSVQLQNVGLIDAPSSTDEPPMGTPPNATRSNQSGSAPMDDTPFYTESDPLLGRLRHLRDEVTSWSGVLNVLEHHPIVFEVPPNPGEGKLPHNVPYHHPKLALHSIQSQALWNFEYWLVQCAARARAGRSSSVPVHNQLVDAIEIQLGKAFDRLSGIKRHEYNNRLEPDLVSTERYFPRSSGLHPTVLLTMLLVATLHLFAQTSHLHTAFVLSAIRLIMQHSLKHGNLPQESISEITDAVPGTLRQVFSFLDVDSPPKPYACCPRCFETYLITPQLLPSYPEHCDKRDTKYSSPCNKRLRRLTDEKWQPTREFLYNSIMVWAARMYARPGMEKYLDNPLSQKTSDCLLDIWDGYFLRQFKGPDGVKHFLDGGSEGRLIFGINQDGMNPFGNRTAGKVVSIGPIYLVCMNLPPHLRYRPENIFLVGIIPGPREPTVDSGQINGILRPLVDELLQCWTTGFWLSRTPRFPDGRRVRIALTMIISDLPAARRLAGVGSHSSTRFCTECDQPIQDRNNLDPTAYTKFNKAEHAEWAEAWRNASDTRERTRLFETHYVRWTEFLRLPYWDTTTMIAIDAMHGFYLVILQHHIRDIWGMNVMLEEDPDACSILSSSGPRPEEIVEAIHCISSDSITEGNPKTSVLLHICKERGMLVQGTTREELIVLLRESLPGGARTVAATASVPTGAQDDAGLFSNEDPEYLFRYGEKKKLSQLSTEALLQLCKDHIGDGELRYHKSSAHGTLVDALQNKRRELGYLTNNNRIQKPPSNGNEKNVPPSKKRKMFAVLGKQVLAEVRNDIKRRVLPPYMGRTTQHPGETRWGKLTADEWKNFCIVHLPFTLVRLWGGYNKSPSDVEQSKFEMLENYLCLIDAILLGTSDAITAETVEEYEGRFREYLSGILALYPDTQITPYQHLMLHFGDQLRRWGPSRHWRCFAFERYNGLLQRLNTNKKFGELESTLTKSFCRRQNLQTLWQPAYLPRDIRPMANGFQRHFGTEDRGSWADRSPLTANSSETPNGTDDQPKKDGRTLSQLQFACLRRWVEGNDYSCDPSLLSSRVRGLREAEHLGKTFKVDSGKRSQAFSNVTTCAGDVGIIVGMFEHTRQSAHLEVKQIFVVVRLLRELSQADSQFDDFRRWPRVTGRLLYSEYRGISASLDTDCVLPLADVTHCILTPVSVPSIQRKVVNVMPIARQADLQFLRGSLPESLSEETQ